MCGRVLAIVALCSVGMCHGQELEPRAYTPFPVNTNFVLASLGRSSGAILFDPSLDIVDVQADLWISTAGIGRTFDLAGRQARILAVFPVAWGSITGEIHQQAARRDLGGLVDPRFKLTIGLAGAPALRLPEFSKAPKGAALGASVTVVPPLGQYESGQLVNLGYNRWAIKPEVGVSRPVGRWSVEGSIGLWVFTTNRAYYPERSKRTQDPVLAVQAHASRSLPHRTWLAVDATWFAGGDSRVAGVVSPDRQRNSRLGATFSMPLTGHQSLKFAYSSGTATRRGSDFDTFSATWQLVMF